MPRLKATTDALPAPVSVGRRQASDAALGLAAEGHGSDAVPDDCTTCGVCCFSRAPDYLRVFGSDYERLGEDAERLTHFIGNRVYMRLTAEHCAALHVDPETGRATCGVYERRPDVCRWLERGSGHCRAEREEKLERARAHLVQLRVVRRAEESD